MSRYNGENGFIQILILRKYFKHYLIFISGLHRFVFRRFERKCRENIPMQIYKWMRIALRMAASFVSFVRIRKLASRYVIRILASLEL